MAFIKWLKTATQQQNKTVQLNSATVKYIYEIKLFDIDNSNIKILKEVILPKPNDVFVC